MTSADAAGDRGEFCRRVEAYLCRKNDGHLIRIVGPAFDTVGSWADKGVPFAIVCQGIDRYVDRHHAKPGRRRPVQIQFCEHDVLALFDDWRRSVGISGDARSPEDAPSSEGSRHGSLASHLERVIARLTALRGGFAGGDEILDRIVRELDGIRASAKGLRGAAREERLDRLRALDDELVALLRERTPPGELAELEREASTELRPFKDRMPHEAYAAALETTLHRLLRERSRIPGIAFD